jgi:hypothetical protein
MSDAAETAGDNVPANRNGAEYLHASIKQHERFDHEYDEHYTSLLMEKTTDPVNDNMQEAITTT